MRYEYQGQEQGGPERPNYNDGNHRPQPNPPRNPQYQQPGRDIPARVYSAPIPAFNLGELVILAHPAQIC